MKTILENVDNLLVQEVRATKRKVVRAGKVVVKMKCPRGFKLNKQTNDCVAMTAEQKRVRSKASLKGAKTRSRDTFGQAQALKQRKKSVAKGTNKGIYTKYPKKG
jgi:hypothetical protein